MPSRNDQTHDPLPPQLLALVGLMALIELALSAADRGWLGATDWRQVAFAYGAFWTPVLDGTVTPLFPGQSFTMFLSHAFLHGGLFHLTMNAVILLSLGKFVSQQAGAWPMLLLFFASAVAGGLGFGLLSATPAPMVGASGAVFGFLGLWQYWEFRIRRRRGLPLRPVFATFGGLVAINVVLAVALQGALAWQAHLGGYVAGVALGPLMTRFARHRAGR